MNTINKTAYLNEIYPETITGDVGESEIYFELGNNYTIPPTYEEEKDYGINYIFKKQ